MAQAKGGVAGFVHRHEQGNAPGDYATLPTSKSMDDLKVSTSAPRKKAGANTSAPRPTRSSTGKQQKMENDTDFSSVDQDSMATGRERSRSNGAPVPVKREHSPPNPDEYDQMTERPDYEADENEKHESDESSDMPHDPFSQLQQHNGNGRSVHERAPGPPSLSAFAQKQIKGDSYPPTSDVDPSVADEPEGLPPSSTQPPESNIQMEGNGGLPMRGGGAGTTRVALHASHRPQIPGHQNHNPRADPATRNVPMAYGAPNSNFNNVVAHANAAFRRPPAMKPGGSRPPAPATAQAPQPVGPPQSRVAATPAATTHVAQRGSSLVTDMSSHPDRRQRYDPSFQHNAAPEPHEHQRPMKRAPIRLGALQQPMPTAGAASVQDTRALPVQRHELTLFRTADINDLPAGNKRQQYKHRESSCDGAKVVEEQLDGQPDGETDESDGEPDNLDYEEEAIYEMSYSFLRNEPSDIDPQAEDLQLPELQQHQTFEAKLKAVSGLSSQLQHAFFTSLPVEQWEAAGDWFLEQFGEVLKKFKAARQDKRKAAKEFEDEIEQRHEAVSKKRKLTEDALSEMKRTGSIVLQGTPKKPKKTKCT